jgi:phosphate transport system permease protein
MSLLLALLAALTLIGFHLGRGRAVALVGGESRRLHSRPNHYGLYVALWCALPALAILGAWQSCLPVVIEAIVVSGLPTEILALSDAELGLVLNDIRNLTFGGVLGREPPPYAQAASAELGRLYEIGRAGLAVVTMAIAAAGLAWGRHLVTPGLRARNAVERVIVIALLASSTVAVLTTIGIVLSLLFETIRFFDKVPVFDFLFGLEWSPQTAIRADQVGASGAFGAVPLFAGTLLITMIAMAVAVPVGLMSAVYLSEYAAKSVRAAVKPILEILAGVPTVAYGFFAAITLAPAIRDLGNVIGLGVASESALAAGLVMGIMIIPFISSLSDDVINAVPQALRDGSLAVGATRSETIKRVVLPAALPGIVGAVLLGVSRAIGETMIVVMAAGLAAKLTANPLEAVTTVTVQIVTLLVGDQEFDSAKTLAAFALGLTLFLVTLALNMAALRVVRRYREAYD